MHPTPKKGIGQIKPHMIGAGGTQTVPVTIALDSNESAPGASPYAVSAASAAAASVHRYHNNTLTLLTSAIAERFALDASMITIGPGSDDLLARIARAYLQPGGELIRSANGYLKVPNYAYANDAVPVSAADNAFTADIDSVLSCVTERTQLVYLANPDNPSGTYVSTKALRALIKQLPRSTMLVLDCAYEEYVDQDDHQDTTTLVEEFDNVVVTRTFSKVFGLAGARVGWMYANPEIIDVINRIGLTFPLASSSIAACVAALNDRSHFDQVLSTNLTLRNELQQRLTNMGLTIYPSQTNFVLAMFSPDRVKNTSATSSESIAHNDWCPALEATKYLRNHGVAIRRFASPAYHDCARITVGLESEQDYALNLLEQWIENRMDRG